MKRSVLNTNCLRINSTHTLSPSINLSSFTPFIVCHHSHLCRGWEAQSSGLLHWEQAGGTNSVRHPSGACWPVWEGPLYQVHRDPWGSHNQPHQLCHRCQRPWCLCEGCLWPAVYLDCAEDQRGHLHTHCEKQLEIPILHFLYTAMIPINERRNGFSIGEIIRLWLLIFSISNPSLLGRVSKKLIFMGTDNVWVDFTAWPGVH